MPLIDTNLASNWDGGETSLYRYWTNNQYRGYERDGAQVLVGNDADTLLTALQSIGFQQGQRIAFIGAGFGWVAERFVALGYGPMADGTANGKICAVDTSSWIQANKGNGNANVNIVNADVNAATGRRTIKQQFGSNNAQVHWALSEDVLPILLGTVIGQNNEIVPFAQSLRQLADSVAHWISTGIPTDDSPATWAGDARLNWKTLEDWKQWVTPDFVIGRGGSKGADQGRVL